MLFTKNASVQGKWVNKKDIKSGTKCKLVSEVKTVPSDFKNDDGTQKDQNLGKLLLEGEGEALNVAVNRQSIDALVDAFGDDSLTWVNKTLTAVTERTTIGGKRVTVLYLVPEGYEVTEDAGGYVVIARSGEGEKVIDLDESLKQNPL
jgi:hypothetical protein